MFWPEVFLRHNLEPLQHLCMLDFFQRAKNPTDLPITQINIFLFQVVQHTAWVSAGDKLIRNMYVSAKPLIACVSQSDSMESHFRECHSFLKIHLTADTSKM